jgi:hypothetical protein
LYADFSKKTLCALELKGLVVKAKENKMG